MTNWFRASRATVTPFPSAVLKYTHPSGGRQVHPSRSLFSREGQVQYPTAEGVRGGPLAVPNHFPVIAARNREGIADDREAGERPVVHHPQLVSQFRPADKRAECRHRLAARTGSPGSAETDAARPATTASRPGPPARSHPQSGSSPPARPSRPTQGRSFPGPPVPSSAVERDVATGRFWPSSFGSGSQKVARSPSTYTDVPVIAAAVATWVKVSPGM
jgi:hypothetical protein